MSNFWIGIIVLVAGLLLGSTSLYNEMKKTPRSVFLLFLFGGSVLVGVLLLVYIILSGTRIS